MRIATVLGMLLTTSCGTAALPAAQPTPEPARITRAVTSSGAQAEPAALTPPSGRMGFGRRHVAAAPARTPDALTAFYAE